MDYFLPGFTCICLFNCLTVLVYSQEQTDLNYIGASLDVKVSITDNLELDGQKHTFEVVFTNKGKNQITTGNWTIYFYSFFMIESDHLPAADGYILPNYNMKMRHIQGCLFSMEPTDNFAPIEANSTRLIEFFGQNWAVSKTDVPPNWYVAAEGLEPVLIQSTRTGTSFLTDMVSVRQWKRYRTDRYNPYTPQDRYRRFDLSNKNHDGYRIIPKPKMFEVLDETAKVDIGSWRIQRTKNVEKEAGYLAEKLALQVDVQDNIDMQAKKKILIWVESGSSNPDWYRLEVNRTQETIVIIGQSASGVFYAIQSLLSLVSLGTKMLPVVNITDEPRFEFRGMHVDMARNFNGKDSLMKLINVMAMYKMNKLHLHLTDDEGWRVEIPGLPELTEVGAKRCHDLNENDCVIPQLGSGPFNTTSGSGYLTIADYKAIVAHATDLHIEIIPEIDTPGHARAAIKSMEVRYRKYKDSDPTEANRYRLIDPTDDTKYSSVQMFNDNAVNPCIESTYAFVEKVVLGLKSMQANLKIFHFGGDEIAGAWINSTECQKLGDEDPYYKNVKNLKEYFVKRVANITHMHGLDLAGWEDGLLDSSHIPFNTDQLPNSKVYGNAWDNVWEWGASRRAYDLANSGYKVIMSQATHLYFDHPYEPDPDERGLYWAPRFTDTAKTFQFMPDNLYANIDFRRSGAPITRPEVCKPDNKECPALNNPENIVGIQGHQWSETVLTSDLFDYMVYPRLLALAERAWHKALWEDVDDVDERRTQISQDWEEFANAVGHREFKRLKSMNVNYRVAPPGAIVENKILKVKTEFPGMTVEYRRDSDTTWKDVPHDWSISDNEVLSLRTRDGNRTSRVVKFHPVERIPIPDQSEVDYISDNIEATFEVISNLVNGQMNYTQNLTFRNIGEREIMTGNWSIYMFHIRLVEQNKYPYKKGFLYKDCGLRLFHISGSLYRLQPEVGLFHLKPQKSVVCSSIASNWQVSRTDTMPNWFIAAEGMEAKVIPNTEGESLDFVKPFLKPAQFRRYTTDQYSPFQPSERFSINENVEDKGRSVLPVIPTPVKIQVRDKSMIIEKSVWKVVQSDDFKTEAQLYAEFLEINISSVKPSSKYIQFQKSNVTVLGNPATEMEAYILNINCDSEIISVTSPSSKGAFYALQTLRKLSSNTNNGKRLPDVNIEDQPRFDHRGMHLDVGRNFHSKEEVLKILDAMSSYKLNKFHLHITEDEGWRIEIKGLEELTKVGAKRCYNPEENKCLYPQLGSGPTNLTSGSGYFTINDYREILRYANERHIQIIPEVDMPSHSRAGIKAMEERYRRQMKYGNATAAEEFLLSEKGDTSEYLTLQWFYDNAVNPCLGSTFAFIHYVMKAFIEMHKDIQPLKMYHFGGDEVPRGTWEKSEACKQLIAQNSEVNKASDLRSYFGKEVGKLAELENIDIGAWEDGLMDEGNVPFNRSHFFSSSSREVYGYAWSNIWEYGNVDRAYKLANAGYKVILSHATHLFFGHPYEPDPEERGYYWATRFTDTRKTFGYTPDDIYANIHFLQNGSTIKPEDVCKGPCLPFKKAEDIVGMQGQLWSETVRTDEELEYMMFPRVLALAERAWHKAPWEDISDRKSRNEAMLNDWTSFANTLGYRELMELDKLGIKYRVPLPGAKMEGEELVVNSAFPGLEIQYSTNNKKTWHTAKGRTKFYSPAVIYVRTLSADKQRHSRVISLESGITTISGAPQLLPSVVFIHFTIATILYFYNINIF